MMHVMGRPRSSQVAGVSCILLISGLFQAQVSLMAEARCLDKYAVFSGHSACLTTSSLYETGGVTNQDKIIIVNEHNKLRAGVKAMNMEKLYWDEELATVAQGWANNCQYKHDSGQSRNIPGTFSVGQNLGKGYGSWVLVIKAWYDEVKDFAYGDRGNFMAVGHYTQLTWATTSRVGCGYAYCSTFRYHVCNYGPAGNVADFSKPYTIGNQCGDCPNNCKDNLCDCGQEICKNGGYRNVSTCECSCKQNFWSKALPFYVGPSCDLNCTNSKDASYCADQYLGKCSTFSNVPIECPNMCQYCPWAGLNYTEGSTALPAFGLKLHVNWFIVTLPCLTMNWF